jgi:hypothetical protein
MIEIIFLVEDDPKGGYVARAIGLAGSARTRSA